MRPTKLAAISIFKLLLFSFSSYAFAAEQIDNTITAPATQTWYDRTDIVYTLQNNYKPVEGIETLQPLYTDISHTVLFPGRLTYNNTSAIANIGLAYRYLTLDKNILFGINFIYDEDLTINFNRIGLGGELFTHYFTFRINYYSGLSGVKFNHGQNQRALNGGDFSVETPLPYVPWSRFVLDAYYWQGWVAKSVNGGYAAFRAYPTRNLELNLGLAHDSSKGNQGFITFNLYIGKPAFIEYSATTSKLGGSMPVRNLESLRLQKVYRVNEIVLEKTPPGSNNTDTKTVIPVGT